jgi:hypothetical protein
MEQIPDPRPANKYTEPMRKALMAEHAHDWDMETVGEAAYICAVVAERLDALTKGGGNE